MTHEELFDYLKDNLRVEVMKDYYSNDPEDRSLELAVTIMLEGVPISKDSITI